MTPLGWRAVISQVTAALLRGMRRAALPAGAGSSRSTLRGLLGGRGRHGRRSGGGIGSRCSPTHQRGGARFPQSL